MTGQTLDAEAGPDSFNVLPALLEGQAGRDHLVEQGNVLAVRQGTWKLIPAPPAGKKRPARSGSGVQLYNLADDIGETRNLADQNEQRVKEMTALLHRVQQDGKSRP